MGVRASKLGRGMFRFWVPSVRRRPLPVPKGYVPVYVGLGGESKRFMIHTTSFGDAEVVELLCKSAEEYGFHNEGVLKIPYDAGSFEERMLVRGDGRRRRRRGMLKVITA